MLIQHYSLLPFLFLCVTVGLFECVCLFINFCCSLTYRFSQYNFACAKGWQHDGHLPFWFHAINPLFISLSLHVLLAVGEINILVPNWPLL